MMPIGAEKRCKAKGYALASPVGGSARRRYKRRNRIEIMFGRLKDWRRVATRHNRCPKVFLSAIALAATVIYWLRILTLEASVTAFPTTNEHVQ